jgi:hypothetical protein
MRKIILILVAILLSAAGPTQFSSFIPKSVTFNGTARTLTTADSGTIIDFTSNAAVTVTLPNNMPYGAIFTFQPNGTGTLAMTTATGAGLRLPAGITKCGPQFSACGVRVYQNTGGSAAQYSFFGVGQ